VAVCWITRSELLQTLSEFAGHKAGLALSRAELIDHLPDADLDGDLELARRLRSEELDEMVRELLYRLGAITSPPGLDPTLALQAKYHADPKALEIVRLIMEESFECARRTLLGETVSSDGAIDITPIAVSAAEMFGAPGLALFHEYDALVQEHLHGGILSSFRRVEWRNVEQLVDLFEKACVTPLHGTFIDQRYIDYLERNPGCLDGMHWRNFEGLTAEFFSREGCKVELGEGQGDGGIDVRVWRQPEPEGLAATILVQCKRQRQKVGQVIVKSLWADVVHEGADSGLIVTTSALQPGAAKVALARGYAVTAADRSAVVKWLHALRTPGTGVSLVE
jgi:restriction system protein